jgi:hypothetical protein
VEKQWKDRLAMLSEIMLNQDYQLRIFFDEESVSLLKDIASVKTILKELMESKQIEFKSINCKIERKN